MRTMRQLTGWALAAFLVVGAGMFIALPAEAESYREVTVADKDWTSENPDWSTTAPTRITEKAPRYDVGSTIWVRHGRSMVKETAVETEHRQNVEANVLADHESIWP